MNKKPFISTTFWVLLGRAGGVLVPFLTAFFMGAGPATDAFFFSYAVIFALQSIFAHIFESALVPFLSERKADAGRSAAFTLSALKKIYPIMIVLSAGLGVLLPFLLGLNSAISSETAGMIPRLYWELFPGLLLAALISAYQGFFYAHQNFWFPSISPLFRTVLMVGFFIFGRERLGIHSLTLGFAAGEIFRWAAAHWILTRNAAFKAGNTAESHDKIEDFFRQASFQFIAVAAISALPLADQWAAVPLGPGNLSLFNYADRFIQVPYLLFFYGFTQVFLSFWSDSHVKEAFQVFFSKVKKDMRTVFLGASALVLVLWFLANPLITLLFEHSNLTDEQLAVLSWIFRWMLIGFVPGILRLLYGRVLMILRKSVFYSVQSCVELAVKIILNLLFAPRFGVAGLAMATAVTYGFTVVWQYVYLNKYSSKKLERGL